MPGQKVYDLSWVRALTARLSCQFGGFLLDLESSLSLENTDCGWSIVVLAGGWTCRPEIAVDRSVDAYRCGCSSFPSCFCTPCFQKHGGSVFGIGLLRSRHSLLSLLSPFGYLVSMFYVPRNVMQLRYHEGQGRQTAGLMGLTF